MNEEAKKKILRMAPHALYVLTSQLDGKVVASTITWFTQVSFLPPLVVVALQKDSRTKEAVRQSRTFAVNMAGANQAEVVQKFFKHAEQDGGNLAGEAFELSPMFKLAVFPGMVGFLECRVTDIVERVDHTVMVAEVVEAGINGAAAPLLLSSTKWQYGG